METLKNIPPYAYVCGVLLLVIGIILAVPKFRGKFFESFRPELYEAGTARVYDMQDNTKLNVEGPQPFGLYNSGSLKGESAYFNGDVSLDDDTPDI